jgi:hypothetical protein
VYVDFLTLIFSHHVSFYRARPKNADKKGIGNTKERGRAKRTEMRPLQTMVPKNPAVFRMIFHQRGGDRHLMRKMKSSTAKGRKREHHEKEEYLEV